MNIKHVHLAFRLVGYNFKKQDLQLLLNVLDLISKTDGEITIEDLVKLEQQNKRKFEDIEND
jgi:hypothetical protein